MANRLTDVIAPLLAYGLLRLRDYHGYEGWRWLFLIEGILTLAIGIWSILMMAPSPTQTKAWWRPKGWFTEREEKIMVNRILRDDPSKGDMHNRQAITFGLLWKSICDFDLWPIYALGITFGIPAGPSDQYLTLTLRQLGFDTFNSNLLSIPAQIGTTVNVGYSSSGRTICLQCLRCSCSPTSPKRSTNALSWGCSYRSGSCHALLPWLYFPIVSHDGVVMLSSPSCFPTLLHILCKSVGAVAIRTRYAPGLSVLHCTI